MENINSIIKIIIIILLLVICIRIYNTNNIEKYDNCPSLTSCIPGESILQSGNNCTCPFFSASITFSSGTFTVTFNYPPDSTPTISSIWSYDDNYNTVDSPITSPLQPVPHTPTQYTFTLTSTLAVSTFIAYVFTFSCIFNKVSYFVNSNDIGLTANANGLITPLPSCNINTNPICSENPDRLDVKTPCICPDLTTIVSVTSPGNFTVTFNYDVPDVKLLYITDIHTNTDVFSVDNGDLMITFVPQNNNLTYNFSWNAPKTSDYVFGFIHGYKDDNGTSFRTSNPVNVQVGGSSSSCPNISTILLSTSSDCIVGISTQFTANCSCALINPPTITAISGFTGTIPVLTGSGTIFNFTWTPNTAGIITFTIITSSADKSITMRTPITVRSASQCSVSITSPSSLTVGTSTLITATLNGCQPVSSISAITGTPSGTDYLSGNPPGTLSIVGTTCTFNWAPLFADSITFTFLLTDGSSITTSPITVNGRAAAVLCEEGSSAFNTASNWGSCDILGISVGTGPCAEQKKSCTYVPPCDISSSDFLSPSNWTPCDSTGFMSGIGPCSGQTQTCTYVSPPSCAQGSSAYNTASNWNSCDSTGTSTGTGPCAGQTQTCTYVPPPSCSPGSSAYNTASNWNSCDSTGTSTGTGPCAGQTQTCTYVPPPSCSPGSSAYNTASNWNSCDSTGHSSGTGPCAGQTQTCTYVPPPSCAPGSSAYNTASNWNSCDSTGHSSGTGPCTGQTQTCTYVPPPSCAPGSSAYNTASNWNSCDSTGHSSGTGPCTGQTQTCTYVPPPSCAPGSSAYNTASNWNPCDSTGNSAGIGVCAGQTQTCTYVPLPKLPPEEDKSNSYNFIQDLYYNYRTYFYIGVGICICILLIFIILICYFIFRRKNKHSYDNE